MKNFISAVTFTILFGLFTAVIQAQETALPPAPPSPTASPTPKLSDLLAKNLENQTSVTRERREQAYAKLLEGQRYIWTIQQRLRSQSSVISGARLAKQAIQKAVELTNLAEALPPAELTLIAPRRSDER